MASRIAYVLLIAILVFTTLAYGGVHQPVIAVYYILIAGAGIAVAIAALGYEIEIPSRELLQLPLIAATVYAFLQAIPLGSIGAVAGIEGIPHTISLDPFSSWLSAFQFTAATIFFGAMLVTLNSFRRIRRLSVFILIFGFAFGFFAILQSVLSPTKIYGIYEVVAGSPFGSFVNRNNFAAYIVMALGIPLGMLFGGAVTKDKWLLYLTAIVLMGIALLLSDSRGGLVAFISEVILIVVLTRRAVTKRGLMIRVGLIALLALSIVAGSVFVGGDTSFTRLAETAASDDFTNSRSHIWRVTLSVIAANMPLGAGFGAFGVAYTPFDDSSGMFRVEQAHNDYLQVPADAGIPGLLVGSLFLFLFIRSGIRIVKIENTHRRGIAIGAFAACFAVLVHSIFDFVLHITAVSLLFLTLLAMVSVTQKMYADDIDNEPQHKRRRKVDSSVERTR